MKIQTFSIIAGSAACNARCPFCVSKMTPPLGVKLKEPAVNWRNFRIACKLAQQSGVTTAMLTSKGEPTLFPDQITNFLEELKPYDFPLIEMQTNGIPIAEQPERFKPYLGKWYELGMTTIAISIIHYDPEKNRQIYLPYKKEYINLPDLIQFLHSFGFSVRLTCIAANGFIDSAGTLEHLIAFAKTNVVEQLTVTPVSKPDDSDSKEAWEWTQKHHLTDEQLAEMRRYIEDHGSLLMQLPHGANVYDMSGQNLCFNHCLTVQPNAEEMRNLIFFPDGHLRYYWQYPGAILL